MEFRKMSDIEVEKLFICKSVNISAAIFFIFLGNDIEL